MNKVIDIYRNEYYNKIKFKIFNTQKGGMKLFDYSKLLGRIKEKFGTNEKFANALGCAPETLSRKLNNKASFTQKEINKSVDLLDIRIEDIDIYFFTKKVQILEHNKKIRN